MIERLYFIGTGEEAKKLIDHCVEQKRKQNETIKDMQARYELGDAVEVRNRLVGFCLKTKEVPPFLKKKGICEGEQFYTAKLSTKIGKQLSKEMNSPIFEFNGLDHILTNTNTKCEAYFGNGIYSSTAGYATDTIFIKVPIGKERPNISPPSWLREVTITEFYDVMEKKRAEPDTA